MKRVKYFILLVSIFMFPLLVNAQGTVHITKVSEQSKTGNVEVISEPTYEGLNIKYNVALFQPNDAITYKVVLTNDEEEDYKISNGDAFSESSYIVYNFAFDNDSDVIKAHTSKEMLVTIKYNKEVPDEALRNGEYVEDNQMNVVLTNQERNVIVNPKTAAQVFLIAFYIVVLLTIGIIVFRKRKKVGASILLIGLFIPISVFALKTITIVLHTNIRIVKYPEFCVGNYSLSGDFAVTKRFRFDQGMTWKQWYNSPYYNAEIASEYLNYFLSYKEQDCRKKVLQKYNYTSEAEAQYGSDAYEELAKCDVGTLSYYAHYTNESNLPIKACHNGYYTGVAE